MNKLCTISEENQDEEDKMNITLALDEILEIEKYSNYKARGVFGEQVLNAERLKKICVEKSIPVSRDDIITSSFIIFRLIRLNIKTLLLKNDLNSLKNKQMMSY